MASKLQAVKLAVDAGIQAAIANGRTAGQIHALVKGAAAGRFSRVARYKMSIEEQILDFGKRARAASRALAKLSTQQKNDALQAMADRLGADAETILGANAKDVSKARADGLAAAMIDRLTLTTERLGTMAGGIRQVAKLPDPVGEVIREWTRPNGIKISKVRVPIGVVGIIYDRARM